MPSRWVRGDRPLRHGERPHRGDGGRRAVRLGLEPVASGDCAGGPLHERGTALLDDVGDLVRHQSQVGGSFPPGQEDVVGRW